MRVNQLGDPVFEDPIFSASDLTDDEAKELLLLLIGRLGLKATKTNATKHGDTQITLETQDE